MVSLNRSFLQGEAWRFSADFTHPLLCLRPFKFLCHLVRPLGTGQHNFRVGHKSSSSHIWYWHGQGHGHGHEHGPARWHGPYELHETPHGASSNCTSRWELFIPPSDLLSKRGIGILSMGLKIVRYQVCSGFGNWFFTSQILYKMALMGKISWKPRRLSL